MAIKEILIKVTIPEDLHRALRVAVSARGADNREIVVEALKEHPQIKRHMEQKHRDG